MSTKETVYIDPMILIKELRKNKVRNKKIELTGQTESYCKDCGETKDIAYFDLMCTKQKTNYRPRLVCTTCSEKKRKTNKSSYVKGSYQNDERVKKWVQDSSRRAREMISDSYVKRMYNKLGFKAKDVTPEMIIAKRLEIIAKRKSAAAKTSETKHKDGTYQKRERENLTDGYVRGLIKGTAWYKGQEITQEKIQEHREKIILKRAMRNKKKREREEAINPYVFPVPPEFKS